MNHYLSREGTEQSSQKYIIFKAQYNANLASKSHRVCERHVVDVSWVTELLEESLCGVLPR